ncbi:helix-hairpin-helix domain-containing protein [Allofustis seminis]|uniref:Tex family protein n=1 Tax=Allofustis seminis TaxID=166939 RepID=UPI00035EEACF
MKIKETRQILDFLGNEFPNYSAKQIQGVLALLDEGNTVPFIARYRKEQTGSLNEVQIQEIMERRQYITHLEKRKNEILNLIKEQDKLTPELEAAILAADQLQRVEDLYRPYKQKRKTLASIAKERGLEPLAEWILTYPATHLDVEAEKYISEGRDLPTLEAVYQGVHEILAERIGDDAEFRRWIRKNTWFAGKIITHKKASAADDQQVYEMYYDYEEPLRTIVSHRILAINRGEKEEVLKVTIDVVEQQILQYLKNKLIPQAVNSPAVELVEVAAEDAYKRFIGPAIEREIRNTLTEKAEEQAIEVFGDNLRHLLLQAPIKGQYVLGFDPAYRTGCKLAAVDPTGKVLGIAVIFPHPPAGKEKRAQAEAEFLKIVKDYHIDTVAIGNGTASRESEQFVASALKKLEHHVAFVIVNESGASVYSASKEARREFPDLQVEERSAVSIARRLQDPLAELVKIDPKSIGVGQYQHDVSQKRLTDQLDFVVETAVNQVGVDLNTASPSLLMHISGLTTATAQNVIDYREAVGTFTNRNQLKEVKRLGPKAFEQAAGFLRILGGGEPLDATAIHPESYQAAEKILHALALTKKDLGTEQLYEKVRSANHAQLRELTGLGKETYEDTMKALMAPDRDIRDDMPAPLLREDIVTLADLKPGMAMEGTVRNVVDFGAFVDIGVGQDGLVHISKMTDHYVSHPRDVVSVGDIVKVWVEDVDLTRQRIGLSMLKK